MSEKQIAPPAERAGLTPDAIVEAAISLADEHGTEAVTIRRVAGALGVTPMALYWHFRKKDDLLSAMADWVFRQMDLSLDPAAGWAERLRSLVEAELAVLRRHPALATLLVTHDGMADEVLRVIELALAMLREAGFSPNEAVQVVQHAQLSVINLVLRQPGRATGRSPEELREAERASLAGIMALSPERYPRIIEAAIPLSSCEDPEEYYAFGIDMLMSGIVAMAGRNAGR